MTHEKWPHTGLWICADIAGDKDLTLAERFVLAYVDGWSRANKPCFASSELMSDVLGLDASYVRTVRAALVEKKRLTKRQVGTKTIFERVVPENSGVGNSNNTVGNSNSECWKNQQKVLEIPTLYNNNNKTIRSDKRESTPPPKEADKETVPYTREWYLAEAERYLTSPTGNAAWEMDNQYILAGRRPMTRFNALWFTPTELADAMEVVINALPPNEDMRPVFRLAQAEALSQAVNRGGTRKVSAYKYVTGYCLQQHQETLRKMGQLKNLQGTK